MFCQLKHEYAPLPPLLLQKAPATAVGTAAWRAEKLGPAGSAKFKDWWEFAGVEGAPEVWWDGWLFQVLVC